MRCRDVPWRVSEKKEITGTVFTASCTKNRNLLIYIDNQQITKIHI